MVEMKEACAPAIEECTSNGAKPMPSPWMGVASAVIAVGWFVALIVWWAFMADDFTTNERLAVALMSALVMGAAQGAMWMPWAMRNRTEADKALMSDRGFLARTVGSGALLFGLLGAIIYWLWYMADEYTGCQSLVVIIVILIAFVGIMAGVWAPWGMRQAKKRTP